MRLKICVTKILITQKPIIFTPIYVDTISFSSPNMNNPFLKFCPPLMEHPVYVYVCVCVSRSFATLAQTVRAFLHESKCKVIPIHGKWNGRSICDRIGVEIASKQILPLICTSSFPSPSFAPSCSCRGRYYPPLARRNCRSIIFRNPEETRFSFGKAHRSLARRHGLGKLDRQASL